MLRSLQVGSIIVASHRALLALVLRLLSFWLFLVFGDLFSLSSPSCLLIPDLFPFHCVCCNSSLLLAKFLAPLSLFLSRLHCVSIASPRVTSASLLVLSTEALISVSFRSVVTARAAPAVACCHRFRVVICVAGLYILQFIDVPRLILFVNFAGPLQGIVHYAIGGKVMIDFRA